MLLLLKVDYFPRGMPVALDVFFRNDPEHTNQPWA